MKSPVLGVTMGDPAGVGPEIIARAAAEPAVRTSCRPVVVGSLAAMREAVALIGVPLTPRAVARVADCRWAEGTVEVLDLGNVDMTALPRGEVSKRSTDAKLAPGIRLPRVLDFADLLNQSGEHCYASRTA